MHCVCNPEILYTPSIDVRLSFETLVDTYNDVTISIYGQNKLLTPFLFMLSPQPFRPGPGRRYTFYTEKGDGTFKDIKMVNIPLTASPITIIASLGKLDYSKLQQRWIMNPEEASGKWSRNLIKDNNTLKGIKIIFDGFNLLLSDNYIR